MSQRAPQDVPGPDTGYFFFFAAFFFVPFFFAAFFFATVNHLLALSDGVRASLRTRMKSNVGRMARGPCGQRARRPSTATGLSCATVQHSCHNRIAARSNHPQTIVKMCVDHDEIDFHRITLCFRTCESELLTVKNVGGYEFVDRQLAVVKASTRRCPGSWDIKKLDD